MDTQDCTRNKFYRVAGVRRILASRTSGFGPFSQRRPVGNDRTVVGKSDRTRNAAVCLRGHQEAYLRFVRSTVERYDGDGVDDMPGLLFPVRFWEIDNQPDIKTRLQGPTPGRANPQPVAGSS